MYIFTYTYLHLHIHVNIMNNDSKYNNNISRVVQKQAVGRCDSNMCEIFHTVVWSHISGVVGFLRIILLDSFTKCHGQRVFNNQSTLGEEYERFCDSLWRWPVFLHPLYMCIYLHTLMCF